jgi:hypothetical protein
VHDRPAGIRLGTHELRQFRGRLCRVARGDRRDPLDECPCPQRDLEVDTRLGRRQQLVGDGRAEGRQPGGGPLADGEVRGAELADDGRDLLLGGQPAGGNGGSALVRARPLATRAKRAKVGMMAGSGGGSIVTRPAA